jgi:protein-disulfide isomerase
MSTNFKVSAIMTIALVAVIAVVAAISIAVERANRPSATEAPASGLVIDPPVLSADTRMLDQTEGAAVTVVEFLDFECESCGAAYPYLERIRQDYTGQVNFAVRYFPLPGHFNSENAAVAAEAAAQQGLFEPMYRALFETQTEWGEQQVSAASHFRDLAESLGADLDSYDDDIADPATLERVQADFAAGRALGVQSTPTFFVNEEAAVLTSSFDDLRAAIDAALTVTRN